MYIYSPTTRLIQNKINTIWGVIDLSRVGYKKSSCFITTKLAIKNVYSFQQCRKWLDIAIGNCTYKWQCTICNNWMQLFREEDEKNKWRVQYLLQIVQGINSWRPYNSPLCDLLNFQALNIFKISGYLSKISDNGLWPGRNKIQLH